MCQRWKAEVSAPVLGDMESDSPGSVGLLNSPCRIFVAPMIEDTSREMQETSRGSI